MAAVRLAHGFPAWPFVPAKKGGDKVGFSKKGAPSGCRSFTVTDCR
jgi:hypothetical protein